MWGELSVRFRSTSSSILFDQIKRSAGGFQQVFEIGLKLGPISVTFLLHEQNKIDHRENERVRGMLQAVIVEP